MPFFEAEPRRGAFHRLRAMSLLAADKPVVDFLLSKGAACAANRFSSQSILEADPFHQFAREKRRQNFTANQFPKCPTSPRSQQRRDQGPNSPPQHRAQIRYIRGRAAL